MKTICLLFVGLFFTYSCTEESANLKSGLNSNVVKENAKSENHPKADDIEVIADNLGNVAYLTDWTEDGYKKMFVVQLEEPVKNLDKELQGTVERNETSLSINSSNGSLKYFYTIDKEVDNTSKPTATFLYSYGIAESTGLFNIKKDTEGITSIYDVIANHAISEDVLSVVTENTQNRPIDELECTSGGVGATECSVDSTIGPVSTGCSVSCGEGYHACCDDSVTICKCLENQ